MWLLSIGYGARSGWWWKVAEGVKSGSVFDLMFLVKWKAQKWKLVESKLVKWSSFGSDLNPHRQQHLMIVEFIYLIL